MKKRRFEVGPPQPAFGYIFGGEESPAHDEDAGRASAAASRHRPSSHSPVLSHKTLGVATPVLWDDGDKGSRASSTTYHSRHDWGGSLPQVVESPGAQGGGSKAEPQWPRGEEAEKRLAEYREHSEHHFLFVAYFPPL